MSQYEELTTTMTDQQYLVEALTEMGHKPDVQPEGTALRGYGGVSWNRSVKADGCGQIRTVGRIAVLASMLNVRTAFTAAVNRVETLVSGLSTKLRAANQTATVVVEPVVYIVCSLAGGTGSGTYMDAALLARSLTKQRAKMVGIFVLLDAFDERSKAMSRSLESCAQMRMPR